MLKDIKEIVEDVTKIDITEKKRDLNNVMARCLYYYFAKKLTKESLAAIGKVSKKDHSTVIHSLSKFDMYYKYYSFFRDCKEQIEIEIINSTDKINATVVKDEMITRLNERYEKLLARNKEMQQELENVGDIDRLFIGVKPHRKEYFKNHQLRSFLAMEKSTVER